MSLLKVLSVCSFLNLNSVCLIVCHLIKYLRLRQNQFFKTISLHSLLWFQPDFLFFKLLWDCNLPSLTALFIVPQKEEEIKAWIITLIRSDDAIKVLHFQPQLGLLCLREKSSLFSSVLRKIYFWKLERLAAKSLWFFNQTTTFANKPLHVLEILVSSIIKIPSTPQSYVKHIGPILWVNLSQVFHGRNGRSRR